MGHIILYAIYSDIVLKLRKKKRKKKTLAELIEQKKDIEEIKSLLLELQQNQEKKIN